LPGALGNSKVGISQASVMGDIQGLLGNDLLQSGVLFFEFFEFLE
jgi:hypothetical protein